MAGAQASREYVIAAVCSRIASAVANGWNASAWESPQMAIRGAPLPPTMHVFSSGSWTGLNDELWQVAAFAGLSRWTTSFGSFLGAVVRVKSAICTRSVASAKQVTNVAPTRRRG